MKLTIFALNSEDNVAKLSRNGADVIDMLPQTEESTGYVVEVADDKVEELLQKLFGLNLEEAQNEGLVELNATIEEEQKKSKEAQDEAVDEAEEMVDEAKEIVNASSNTWSAVDDFVFADDSNLEVVDTSNGKLLISDGYILGFLYSDNASDAVKDMFEDNAKLASTIKSAILAEKDLKSALEPFGFESYTVELDDNEVASVMAKSKIEAFKNSYKTELENLKPRVEQALAMGMLATAKGLTEPCPIKEAMVSGLEQAGAEGAEEFVDTTLEEAIPAFVKSACVKAYEYLAQDDKTRNEVSKTIEASAFAPLPKKFTHKVS